MAIYFLLSFSYGSNISSGLPPREETEEERDRVIATGPRCGRLRPRRIRPGALTFPIYNKWNNKNAASPDVFTIHYRHESIAPAATGACMHRDPVVTESPRVTRVTSSQKCMQSMWTVSSRSGGRFRFLPAHYIIARQLIRW